MRTERTEIYSIDCTGDCVVGDQIIFNLAIFSGSYRSPKFEGYKTLEATIERESYGAAKQQHTFTLKLSDGSAKKIKGRNLYKLGTYRKPWINEAEREAIREEKHERGAIARTQKAERLNKILCGGLF